MIPKDLKSPLGEIKPPLAKAYIITLIMAIIGLTGAISTQYFLGNSKSSANEERLQQEILDLRGEVRECKDGQIRDFQLKAAAQKTLDSTERIILNRLR